MSADTAKTVFTYLIALVVIVGGGLLLVIKTQVDSGELLPFLTGIIGTVIGYVFSERSSTAASDRAERLTGTASNGNRG